MAELLIRVNEFIGESSFNWDTFEFEAATSAADIRMQVEYATYNGQTIDSICLEIGTCYGGSTIAGTEIYNYLQGLGIPVRTRILSLAASMATILMLVGDACEIDAAASIMVHAPSMETWGTAREIGASLKGLTDTQQALHDIYVARTGQTTDVVQEWMSKDTWFTAAEALAVGLVTKVIPIAPKAAPALTDAQASARRARYAGIVARADKRTIQARQTPKPKAKTASALNSPRPMPTVKPKAAAKPAAKPAVLTASQKANMKIVADLAKSLGVKATIEGTEAEVVEIEAVAEATVLMGEDGTLYTDGPMAVDSAVFNDEALTVVTADNDYEAEDGRTITVAGGICTAIVEATAETKATDTTAAITAAITAALAPITAKMATMEATFSKAVPPTPRAKGGGSQVEDVKTPKAKAKAAHHSQL